MRLRLFVVLCRSNAGERQRPAVGDGGRIINTVDMRPWGRETIPKMKQGESIVQDGEWKRPGVDLAGSCS
jgi:hypothetical protein